MLNANVISNSLSDTAARLFGWNSNVNQSAQSVHKAMHRAAKAVAAENRDEIEGLFEKSFLVQHGTPIVSDYCSGRLPRHEAAVHLTSAWESLKVAPGARVSKQRRADAVMAADRFLSHIEL